MIKYVFFLGYATSWVTDNMQLIKYDCFFFPRLVAMLSLVAIDQHVGKLSHRLWWFAVVALQMIGGDCGPGPWFSTKISSYRYRKSHRKDKTILWPSYLHISISHTGKTTYLYWIGALVSWIASSFQNTKLLPGARASDQVLQPAGAHFTKA